MEAALKPGCGPFSCGASRANTSVWLASWLPDSAPWPLTHPITLSLEESYEDSGHGAVEALGLPEDPLEPISKGQLIEKLQGRALEALTEAALTCHGAYGTALEPQAARLLKERWHEPAAEALVQLWALERTEARAEAAKATLVEHLGASEEAVRLLERAILATP